MGVKFFSQFLLERKIITREGLLKAIQLQESINLKFGEMAMVMNIMSRADVERVHDAQKAEDLKLGDLAVKMGIITEEQMQQVLARQKSTHIYIGEALVQVGALPTDKLSQYLEEYNADQALYASHYAAVPEGVPHAAVWEMAADISAKMVTRILNLPCRLGECAKVNRLEKNDVVGIMGLKGDVSGSYLLSVSLPLRKVIACALLKESNVDAEPEEVLDDTVMEFVNIICGNLAAKVAQHGKTLEIEPPGLSKPGVEGIEVPPGHVGIVFPIILADEEQVEVALFVKG